MHKYLHEEEYLEYFQILYLAVEYLIIFLLTPKTHECKENYYVFHDRVTLFFADNFSMECQIIVKFLHNFF